MKKKLKITADIFDNKYLTALMDFMAFVSPAKTKNETEIRKRDKKLIIEGKLGQPVERKPANIGGRLDRNRILSGTTIFGRVPKVTENDIKLISEAGFDFIINGNDGEYAKKILDWCEKYNIAVIGKENRKFLKSILLSADVENPSPLDRFVPHPASVGDCCSDEPHSSDFGFVQKFHRAYRKHFPDRFVFTNLLPDWGIKSVWGENSYAEYVDKFSSMVESDYLSVDVYPFHPSRILNKIGMSLYLNTYHTIGNACRRDGKDFWLYIQSQMRWFSHLYTMTTFEMIKWQVYASLCYGCRSIIHASYNPVWGRDAIGIIDYNGNLTEQYLYVKRVNAEIAKLSPVLKDYRSLGVEFAKAKRLNHHFVFACRKQKKNNKAQGFTGIPAVKSIESESTALAGYFANTQGRNALMLVNCRNIYDPYASQNITVKFARKYTVSVYEHGERTRTENTDEITVTPGSCDGVFITMN
jgi:hypothetical protein